MKTSAGLMMVLGVLFQPVLAQTAQDQQTVSPTNEPMQIAPGSTSGGSTPIQSEAGMDLRQAPSPIARLKPVTKGDVTYLCGGIGEEETAYMKQEARDYDLMLTFAAQDGAYLADVNVDIRNAGGEPVLQVDCDSPILLVQLPQRGRYKVRADAAGYAINRTVTVAGPGTKGRGRTASAAVLVWPQQVAERQGSGTTSSGDSGVHDAGSAAGSAAGGQR